MHLPLIGYWVTHPLCVLPSVPTSNPWNKTPDTMQTRHHANHALSRTWACNQTWYHLHHRVTFVNNYTIKQRGVRLHWRLLVFEKYLAHVNVTSCAITGFVCTKSCSWVYLPVEVCWYSRSDPKQANSNWAVHYTASSWSTLSSNSFESHSQRSWT